MKNPNNSTEFTVSTSWWNRPSTDRFAPSTGDSIWDTIDSLR